MVDIPVMGWAYIDHWAFQFGRRGILGHTHFNKKILWTKAARCVFAIMSVQVLN
uniref:Uncharacterized protein n=1 Tax=Anguilla anguilla TaxID=7936 RepID=A0A0E9RMX0_ANGAN